MTAKAGDSFPIGTPTAESAFTPDALFQRIVALMDSPETLAKAARAAGGLGRPDAAERLADLVLATAGDAVGEAAA